ncbi:unnamed protein product [Rotaria sp. Silwood2]|nr:unnamed protein product [Rotaria sp. Silwood2]
MRFFKIVSFAVDLSYSGMPKSSKRKSQSNATSAGRWSKTKIPDVSGPSNVNILDANDQFNANTSGSRDSSDSEYRMDTDDIELDFSEEQLLTDIGDLAEMCKSKCGTKYLSTLLYMSLRFLKIKWEAVDAFLKRTGLMTAQTSHKWATIFIKGDYEEFSNDLRGGKQTDSFYDTFPDIEADAKAFVIHACSQKSADFKAMDLAQFIDEKYYEITGIIKQSGDDLIRSKSSCRLDLRRWGAKFEANSQRPYFEGHERDDVVKHRTEFINYFLAHKDSYYTITDGETPMWKIPTQTPHRILIFHNESTFRNGEGEYKGKSKGLVQLCKDLGIQLPAKIKLGEIIKILSTHPAFQNDSRIHFVEQKTALKLSRRFWRSIEAYSQGQTC